MCGMHEGLASEDSCQDYSIHVYYVRGISARAGAVDRMAYLASGVAVQERPRPGTRSRRADERPVRTAGGVAWAVPWRGAAPPTASRRFCPAGTPVCVPSRPCALASPPDSAPPV